VKTKRMEKPQSVPKVEVIENNIELLMVLGKKKDSYEIIATV